MILPRPDLSVLCYDLRSSGVVRNALRIAGAASAAGLRTEIWAARVDGQLCAEVPDGVVVVDAGHKPFTRNRTIDLAAAVWPLASYLKARRPRIALSSGNHMHVAASLAYSVAGRPKDVSLWGRASNATLAAPFAAYLGRPVPRIIGSAINVLNRLQYSAMARIIAVCEELGKNLVHDLGLPQERVSVIANGVDCPAIAALAQAPLDSPWADGELPLILSAGRLSKQKNFADLIRAVALMQRQSPARLVILGDGKESEKRALEALASRHGIADRVHLPGFEANPYRWMARASVFAISSHWEGASNVALEALAAGTPVVAYRCPTGIAEVIEPLGRELVVDPGNIAGLADAIAKRLALPRDAASLKEHAARFDLKVMLQSYVAHFSSALR